MINTTHNLKIVNITDFAPNTPPANNIFLAYQIAQGSNPGSAILINTPFYLDPNSAQSKALPSFESQLKAPVVPVFDPVNWAKLVGTNPIIYPISLW